jgi:hypothetical protein
MYLAVTALYAMSNLAISCSLALQAGWRHILRLPLAFATLHAAYGFGFWAGMLRFGPPWRANKLHG